MVGEVFCPVMPDLMKMQQTVIPAETLVSWNGLCKSYLLRRHEAGGSSFGEQETGEDREQDGWQGGATRSNDSFASNEGLAREEGFAAEQPRQKFSEIRREDFGQARRELRRDDDDQASRDQPSQESREQDQWGDDGGGDEAMDQPVSRPRPSTRGASETVTGRRDARVARRERRGGGRNGDRIVGGGNGAGRGENEANAGWGQQGQDDTPDFDLSAESGGQGRDGDIDRYS